MTPEVEAPATDEQVLDRRVKGEAFATIAKALGMVRPTDANRAFNRALRRRPADEQAAIRAQENHRLDLMVEAVQANQGLSEDEAEKRLHSIERLRARLTAD